MARCLALEWDHSEARIVVMRSSHREVVIEQAFTAPVSPEDPGQTPSDDDVGRSLSGILTSRRLAGLDALLAIGRNNVELRMLTLPPAPDDELPELVRFQAQTQFATLGGDWALDFLPLSGDEQTPRTVLAAGISPSSIASITRVCETTQLKPRKLLLRSCSAASLLRRQTRFQARRICLMVDLLSVEADLTVLLDGHVVFMRTVRLSGPTDSAEQSKLLVGEILRTMAAAHNQLNGERVEQIVLFGREGDKTTTREQIEKRVRLPVELLDPFGDVPLSADLAASLPEPGGFAPLVGALLDEAHGLRHDIDFLHPRRKPEPPNRRRAISIAAGIAAVVLAVVTGIVWWQLAAQDRRIETLQEQLQQVSDLEEAARQRIAEVQQIDDWARSDVFWLEELAQLSDEFPEAEAAIVTRLVAGGRNRATQSEVLGEFVLDGHVDQRETISRMETALRDAGHKVYGTGGQYDDRRNDYPWKFKERVEIIRSEQGELEPSAENPAAVDRAAGGPSS